MKKLKSKLRARTETSGARKAMSAILAQLRQMMEREGSAFVNGKGLEKFILTMDERWNRRKGGLGRK